ncbi:MAG: amino acid ABC transporter substrate-binding protein, partial [Thermosynechococcaceae cyanobacterium]
LCTAIHPAGPGFEAFRDRFRKTYHTDPTIYDPNTWDAAALAVLAAASAQATTGTALRDRLREVANPPGKAVVEVCDGLQQLRQGQDIDYQGVSGTVDLNAEGDVTGSYDVWQIQPDGTQKIVETLTIQ